MHAHEQFTRGKSTKSITCTSRYIYMYMTHFMYQSGCHIVTPYVIAIYRTCIYCKPDNE